MVTGIPGHPIQSKRNYCNLHLPTQRSTMTGRCLKILKAAYSTAGLQSMHAPREREAGSFGTQNRKALWEARLCWRRPCGVSSCGKRYRVDLRTSPWDIYNTDPRARPSHGQQRLQCLLKNHSWCSPEPPRDGYLTLGYRVTTPPRWVQQQSILR